MAPSTQLPPRLDDAPWLARRETQAVFAALIGAGHEARCVGGAVRNALMKAPVTDVDIATTAKPEEAMAAATAAGLDAIATGIEHGTVTLIAGDIAHEVTTLREDVETFGRHAKVAFTADWAGDARRRDFTMNALYCDRDGVIYDPLGGYEDLSRSRVRFIGDARTRLREDYLRILRFFRFNAQYSEEVADAPGLAACIAERDGLARLSPERIRVEFLKLLAAPGASMVCEAMFDNGFLPGLLGAAPRLTHLKRLNQVQAALGLSPDPILRLAVLTVAVEEDAERIARRLRLSNTEAQVLAQASVHERHDGAVNSDAAASDAAASDAIAKAQLYRLGRAGFQRRVLIDWARSGAECGDQHRRALYELPVRWQPPALPFSGRHLLSLGLAPGPQVGAILRDFESWWIASGFPADESANLAKLKQLAGTGR